MKKFTITVKCHCSHEFTVQCGFPDSPKKNGTAPIRCDKCSASLSLGYNGQMEETVLFTATIKS